MVKGYKPNIKHIIIGWWKRLTSKMNDEEKRRYDICMKCSDKEKIFDECFCGLCGCPIKSKVRVPEEHCLNDKW